MKVNHDFTGFYPNAIYEAERHLLHTLTTINSILT